MFPFVRVGKQIPLKISVRTNSSKITPINYCVDLVRKYDNENFLCTLLIPKPARSTAFAVRAFNIEISQVGDKTKDKMRAVARMKFWEEAVDEIYKGNSPHHPVALELTRSVEKHKLLKKQLKRLVIARLNALSSSSTMFTSLQQMEEYSEETVSPVYYLILQAADIKDVTADHVASHLGKAQGLSNLIRSIPYHSSQRTMVLPQELLTKYNISHEDVVREKPLKGLRDAVFEIASSANAHLLKARSFKTSVHKDATPLFLPAIPLDNYLERLRHMDFDVFSPFLRYKTVQLGASLFWRRLLGIY